MKGPNTSISCLLVTSPIKAVTYPGQLGQICRVAEGRSQAVNMFLVTATGSGSCSLADIALNLSRCRDLPLRVTQRSPVVPLVCHCQQRMEAMKAMC